MRADKSVLAIALGSLVFAAVLAATGVTDLHGYVLVPVAVYFVVLFSSPDLRRARGRWVLDAALLVLVVAVAVQRTLELSSGG